MKNCKLCVDRGAGSSAVTRVLSFGFEFFLFVIWSCFGAGFFAIGITLANYMYQTEFDYGGFIVVSAMISFAGYSLFYFLVFLYNTAFKQEWLWLFFDKEGDVHCHLQDPRLTEDYYFGGNPVPTILYVHFSGWRLPWQFKKHRTQLIETDWIEGDMYNGWMLVSAFAGFCTAQSNYGDKITMSYVSALHFFRALRCGSKEIPRLMDGYVQNLKKTVQIEDLNDQIERLTLQRDTLGVAITAMQQMLEMHRRTVGNSKWAPEFKGRLDHLLDNLPHASQELLAEWNEEVEERGLRSIQYMVANRSVENADSNAA